ncbi:MAG: hypothetical protein RPR40_03760 [Bermanella sp.]
MINAKHLRDYVVQPALKNMGMWSEAAENLLIGTIYQESRGGHYLRQLGNGPALGIYQIEPVTHEDVWANFISYRRTLERKVAGLLTGEDRNSQLISNLSYATVIARIIYYRRPDALPGAWDIKALAEYWKEHYNTRLGKGTVEEFMQNFPMELLEEVTT